MGKKRKELSEFRAERTTSESYYDVKTLRQKFGLRPLKPGKARCLKCDNWFISPDIVTVRRCDSCRAEDEIEIVYLEELEGEDLLDTSLLDEEDSDG